MTWDWLLDYVLAHETLAFLAVLTTVSRGLRVDVGPVRFTERLTEKAVSTVVLVGGSTAVVPGVVPG